MANETEIGKLVLRLVAEVGDLKKGLQESKKDVKDFTDSSKKASQSLGGTIGDIKAAYLGYVAAIYSAWQTIKKVMDWVEIGAKSEAVAESFSILTQSLSIDGDALAAKIKETSYVFVEQTEMMVKAQRLFIEGIKPSQVVKLTEASRVAARLMGIDVAQAFDRISEAVITLRTIGIKAAFPMDVAEVMENYARSLGTVSKYLSEAGQRQAVVNEILRQSAEKTDLLGGKLEPNLSEKIQKIKSSWKELQDGLGKAIGVQIEPIINALVDMITMVEKAQKSWQTMPEVIKVALREIAVTAALAIPGVGPLIAQTIRASQLKAAAEAAKPPELKYEEIMKEQDAAVAAGLKAQEEANKKKLINERKLQEDLTKFRLVNEEQRIAAINEMDKSNLESRRVMAIAEAKVTSADVTMVEMAWDRRMAEQELSAIKAALAVKLKAEKEAAQQAGMDVANVEKKFQVLRLAAEQKYAADVAKINARLVQERSEAYQKAYQAEYGVAPAMEPFFATAEQTGEMDVRTKNLELKKQEFDIGQKIAESQMEERFFRITKEQALRSEIDLNGQLLATYETELQGLNIGNEGYSDLQSKIAGVRDRLNELNYSLNEQTASFGELVELGLKKYAVSIKDNLITSMENLVPNAFDSAGNSIKGFFNDLVDGTMSAKDALKKMVDSFMRDSLNMIIDIGLLIAKMEILKALGYGTGGGGGGGGGGLGNIFGTIFSFISTLFAQTGGLIRGPSGTDVVPVRATAGEYMLPVKAASYYGINFLEALRTMQISRERLLTSNLSFPLRPRPSFALAAGGAIPSLSETPIAGKEPKTEITLINVVDQREMDMWAASSRGQNAIINVISSRMDSIKRIMR